MGKGQALWLMPVILATEDGVSFFSCSFVGASFLSLLVITEPNWGLTGGDWRCRKKKGQTDRQKVGSGVLGAWMETHNSHCFFSLSLFFKALLLYSSLKSCLKPLSLDSLCPMFFLSCSLAYSLKDFAPRLALSL
jgi:hypothetical protein